MYGVMWFGHFAVPLRTATCRVSKHVRRKCAHPGAKQQREGYTRCRDIYRKPRTFVLGDAVWSSRWSLVNTVMQCVFCGVDQLRHMRAHLHCE